MLASYALDPRNAFNQTNLKAINQSLTNYNINPDMGAVRAMVEDGLPPLELGLDPICEKPLCQTMAAHDLHHGGEIGCLRDLYRLSQERPA